jgi:hypothetical protein
MLSKRGSVSSATMKAFTPTESEEILKKIKEAQPMETGSDGQAVSGSPDVCA